MIAFLVGAAVAIDKWPEPACHSNPIPKLLPITIGETVLGSLDDQFKGYNLEFSVPADPSNSVIVTRKKLDLIKTYTKSMPGLESFKLDHVYNDWGSKFVATARDRVYLGKLVNYEPVIDNEIIVQNNTDEVCYDSYWDEQIGLLITDCAKKLSSPDENGNYYQNVFYYVDTNSKTRLNHTFQSQMYVPFNHIWRRRVYNFTEPSTQMKYMLRVYFEDGVDEQHSSNTYVQIFSMVNPYYPWVVKIIDRSFIGKTSLKIADFKIYAGDFYLLDTTQGLFRFDLTKGLHVVLVGAYHTSQGFTRFGVFHSRLDGKQLIALANNHAVYEIDWTVTPVLIAKYSLLHNSYVRQVWLNERFLVVQSSANTTLGDSWAINNYTWVMNRGDRTYGNAFKIIDHKHFQAFIDLNRRSDKLLVADEEGVSTYQLNMPFLSVNPVNPSLQNRTVQVPVIATSSDPHSNSSQSCTLRLNISFVSKQNKSIFVTESRVSSVYNTIYPGQAQIALYDYAIGPNLTYVAEPLSKHDAPEAYVLQQNESKVFWSNGPTTNIIFYQMFQNFNAEESIVFAQTTDYTLHIGECKHGTGEDSFFNCSDASTEHLGGPIQNMSIFKEVDTHLFAVSVGNTVRLFDFARKRVIFERTYPSDFSGVVSGITLDGLCLFVTLKYAKTIECVSRDHRFRGFTLDTAAAIALGIGYWSPLSVVTSALHPRTFFVTTYDAVYAVNYGTDKVFRLLTTIDSSRSQAVQKLGFKVAVNDRFMLLMNTPNIIEEFAIAEIESGRLIALKSYPIYHYQIPANFNFSLTTFTNLFFIQAVDTISQRSVVLAYNAGTVAHAVLYNVIMLESRAELLVDTSGFIFNLVGVVTAGKLRVFRVFDLPFFIVDTFVNHNYTLDVQSYGDNKTTFNLQIQVASIPSNISLNPGFSKHVDLTNSKTASFSDKGWVNGSVIDYKCENCNNRLNFKGHVWERADVISTYGLYDYSDSGMGGYATSYQSIFQMYHNGSIRQISNYPSHERFEACTRIAADVIDIFAVSACQNFGNVNLYLTSYASRLPFTMGPFETGALSARKLQVAGEVIMLVDVNRYTEFRFQPGAIFLFDINSDPEEPILEELEQIDSNDFLGCRGWNKDTAYIGNADIQFTTRPNVYRLVITQLDSGFFTLYFSYKRGAKQINILQTAFTDLNVILKKYNYSMPLNSDFEAVRLVDFVFDPKTGREEVMMIVTTRNFHSFVFNVTYEGNGVMVDIQLVKVLLKYGYYNVNNYIKTIDGLAAVGLTLPLEFHWIERLAKQLLVVYDVRDHRSIGQPQGTVKEVGFIGGIKSNSTFQFTYDFNFTVERHNTSFEIIDLGLMAIDPLGLYMRELRVSRNLTVEKTGKVNTVGLKFTAYNDYHNATDQLMLVSDDYLEWYEILLIVLFGLGVLVGLGYAAFVLVKKEGDSASQNPDFGTTQSPLLGQDLAEQQNIIKNEPAANQSEIAQ